jgi:molybdopterin-containing oxidoreductase family iron-sulfur binding subunit
MSCGQSADKCGNCSTGEVDTGRRDFLKHSAAAAGMTLASGVTLYAVGAAPAVKAEEPVTDKVRWGMLVDVNRCNKGCDACVTACNKENGIQGHDRPLTDPQWIRKIDVMDPKSGFEKSLPMMCQHCAEPPCVDVCPTGASFKRADGIVLVDKHICIGCRYCMMACPYKARSFVHETLEDQKPHAPRGKGTVESCTMCVHRVDEGQSPACVEACIDIGQEAILFGDLNDPESEISKRIASYGATEVRADLGLNLGVKYQNL